MRIKVRTHDKWRPTWNGNQDLPVDEQIVFNHRFPKADERKDYIYLKPIQFNISDYAEMDEAAALRLMNNRELVEDKKGLARAITTGIDNLEIDNNGEIKRIETIDDLYNLAVAVMDQDDDIHKLVTEYENYCLTCSKAVDSKNSESVPGSFSSDTDKKATHSGGLVKTAKEKLLTPPGNG